MTGTFAQLRALVGMRWRMVRSRRVRAGLGLLALTLPALLVVVVVGARLAPSQRAFDAALVTPTAFLVYAVLAVIGPLAAGGGNELFPADQLVPHPVRPSTIFAASVLLAPLNLAWVVQITTLLALTSYVSGSWHGLAPALTLTAVYAAAATIAGQAAGWWVTGLRHDARGRLVAWGLFAACAATVALALHVGLTRVLDRAPTKPVVLAMLGGAAGRYSRWATTLVALIGIGVVAALAGVWTTAATLRRPDATIARRQARTVARRRDRRRAAATLRAVNRASVLRAPSLRRGLLVLALLPGFAAGAARVQWSMLALTGGLVATGAGLLYGVNVFCLDGTGALWLTSQPLDPDLAIRAKARVLAETCLACVVIALVAGASRARGTVTATVVATVLATVVVCTAHVVATCLKTSVHRPHRADLTGRRDAPAPPGAMAVHSARLAVGTTFLALIVGASGAGDVWWAPCAMGAALTTLSISSLRRTYAAYRLPRVSATVAATVAGG